VILGMTVFAVVAWHLVSPLQAYAKSDERPNIVLILADDLGFSDIGCYGGEIRTPNLDRLAKDGLRFTQFYNCAVCVTTRAALMTGLHPRRGSGNLLRDDMVTIAEVMRDAGYHTSLTGKWHLGSSAPRRPTDRGFEEYYGVASGCCNFFDPSLPDPVFYNGGKRRPFLHNTQRVTEFGDDYFTTDAFAAHAVQQIERFARDDAPFFVHACFTAPHFPLHAKPEDIARYQGKYKAGYFAMREQRYKRMMELGIVKPHWKLSAADHRLGEFRYDYDITPWEEVEDRVREERRMEVYAAMVDCLDQAIGRILEALEKTGVADNTLVMFLSDNGGCASYPAYGDPKVAAAHAAYNRELPGGKNTYDFCGPGWGWAQCAPFRRYKVWTYEGGISTPMIARWPGTIKPGTMTDQVGHLVDFMPTLLQLAGGEYPSRRGDTSIPAMEGKSLLPVLRGQQREAHDHLCWYLYGNRAVRQGNWKLVWGVTAKKWELYDMEADRTETTDLAAKKPELVERLSALWEDWAQRTEVPLTGSAL
jgi:arylsulfatase